jgi:hypothetical protein
MAMERGPERVAGGVTMSKEASTAALETFSQRTHRNQRRVPGHEARSKEARIVRTASGRESAEIEDARILSVAEDTMKSAALSTQRRERRIILPAILRVSLRVLAFVLWTTLAGSAFAQTGERREVRKYPVKRAAIENLQRWVDSGHDEWCRHADFVAAATLRTIAPEAEAEYQLTSASLEKERETRTRSTYTYHSLDGRVTYRITVRRYAWQRKSAGGMRNAIWVPERADIVTKATSD